MDDATADKICATFILDVALLHSFGRTDRNGSDESYVRGLSEKQKEFIVALALWKIEHLLNVPFRYRSGCHLELENLKQVDTNLEQGGPTKIERDVMLDVNIKSAIKNAEFRGDDETPTVTDIYWVHDDLYREGKDRDAKLASPEGDGEESSDDDGEDS